MPREEELFVQCRLSAGDSRLIAFVPFERKLRAGVQITLKDSPDPDQLWTIDEIGQPVARSAIKRGWNNNI